MSTTDALSIDLPSFKSTGTIEADRVSIKLAGIADALAHGPLEDLLRSVHATALEQRAREVVVDIRAVDFMSSSGLSKIVGWVSRVRDGDEASRYRIRILSNQAMLWQRRSLHAVQCFAVDLVTVEDDSPPK